MTADFNDLKMARAMGCEECNEFAITYMNEYYLYQTGRIRKDAKFEKRLLADFEQHIRNSHPERAKQFLP